MTDLTGAPSHDFDIEDTGVEEVWKKLVTGERKGYLMACSAGTTNSSAEILEGLGLVAEHSYGLLKVCEINNESGERIRLCLLRNPWGDFEWNGDWSDTSDLWTPDIKR
jgi:calpain-15